jgi:hypothetical protein
MDHREEEEEERERDGEGERERITNHDDDTQRYARWIVRWIASCA